MSPSICPNPYIPIRCLRPSSFDLKLHDLMERKRRLSRGLLAPAEDDGDADALFDSVVVDPTANEELATAQEPAPQFIAPESLELPAHQQRRGTLRLRPASLRSVPPTTPERAPFPSRVVYEEGGLRDYAIFTAPVDGEPIETLEIVDPYAAADGEARRKTVRFAKMLIGESRPDARLVTFDAESVSSRTIEDSNTQYDDMISRWQRELPQVPLRFDQHSRQGNRQLHDREVRALLRDGRTIVWDLGRGIDGVMSARYRCVVNCSINSTD